MTLSATIIPGLVHSSSREELRDSNIYACSNPVFVGKALTTCELHILEGLVLRVSRLELEGLDYTYNPSAQAWQEKTTKESGRER